MRAMWREINLATRLGWYLTATTYHQQREALMTLVHKTKKLRTSGPSSCHTHYVLRHHVLTSSSTNLEGLVLVLVHLLHALAKVDNGGLPHVVALAMVKNGARHRAVG